MCSMDIMFQSGAYMHFWMGGWGWISDYIIGWEKEFIKLSEARYLYLSAKTANHFQKSLASIYKQVLVLIEEKQKNKKTHKPFGQQFLLTFDRVSEMWYSHVYDVYVMWYCKCFIFTYFLPTLQHPLAFDLDYFSK